MSQIKNIKFLKSQPADLSLYRFDNVLHASPIELVRNEGESTITERFSYVVQTIAQIKDLTVQKYFLFLLENYLETLDVSYQIDNDIHDFLEQGNIPEKHKIHSRIKVILWSPHILEAFLESGILPDIIF